MSTEQWSDETEQLVAETYLNSEVSNDGRREARDILAALTAAGLLLPPGGETLYAVVKGVPGREPEVMADLVSDLAEVSEWVADLTANPDRDPLAAYIGYRLVPIPQPSDASGSTS